MPSPRRRALLLATLLVSSTAACHRGGTETTPRRDDARAEAPASDADASDEDLPGLSREPTETERGIIQGLMRDAAAVRRLPFLREVPAAIQDETRIRAFVTSDIDRDELREARELYVAIGLLPADIDLESLIVNVLGEQIVGYYDPERERLVVREDVMRTLATAQAMDEARVVLVHELVHALQDQHLDLDLEHDRERDSDADNAYRAVVEGDATLAMVAYALASQGVSAEQITGSPAALREIFSTGMAVGGEPGELERAPAILRVTLMAPYLSGAIFCADRHRRGGWPSVDGAHRVIPASTEQILHPNRYQASEPPIAIAVPPQPALERLGYARGMEDTLGELELSIYLARGTGADRDEIAGEGWGGDRVVVYTHASASPAAVWMTRWDDAVEAEQAELAGRRVAAEDASVHVLRRGTAVLFLHHVPEPARAAVVASFPELATP